MDPSCGSIAQIVKEPFQSSSYWHLVNCNDHSLNIDALN